MLSQQVVIAARNTVEIERISAALAAPPVSAFTHANALLERIDTPPVPLVLTTSLLMDETAFGLLSRAAVLGLPYIIVYALHASEQLNILRIYGSGAFAVLGPDELALANAYLSPSEDCLNESVFPPFLNDQELLKLKPPPVDHAEPLHMTCLGAQALMTCSNALMHLSMPQSLSMACVAPKNAWARQHMIKCLRETTLWRYEADPKIADASLTLADDFDTLSKLKPKKQHVILSHGHLSDEELKYMQELSPETPIYMACSEGYLLKQSGENLATPMTSNKLWEALLSLLYTSRKD